MCSLFPTKVSVLRIFVATSWGADSYNCCIINTCHDRVLKVTNGPLFADSMNRSRLLSVLHALSLWLRLVMMLRAGGRLKSLPNTPRPSRSLATVLSSPRLSGYVSILQPPYRDKGIQLALAGCNIPGLDLLNLWLKFPIFLKLRFLQHILFLNITIFFLKTSEFVVGRVLSFRLRLNMVKYKVCSFTRCFYHW